MSARFRLAQVDVALPQGASARTHRRMLFDGDRPLFGLTQGRMRACLYPVFSPRGFLLTSESPSDHPHHNSIWIAADHVVAHVPVAGGRTEDYTYNFYVDEVFQGRAPGRIVETGCALTDLGDGVATLTQTLAWRGPSEWGAPDGRLVFKEERAWRIEATAEATILDVASTLTPPHWDVTIGPTRHAYFNARVAETIAVTPTFTSDAGDAGGRLPYVEGARWLDVAGPVGGGHRAGIALRPAPVVGAETAWFATDWGVVTVGPYKTKGRLIAKGTPATLRCRIVFHDGRLDPALLDLPLA